MDRKPPKPSKVCSSKPKPKHTSFVTKKVNLNFKRIDEFEGWRHKKQLDGSPSRHSLKAKTGSETIFICVEQTKSTGGESYTLENVSSSSSAIRLANRNKTMHNNSGNLVSQKTHVKTSTNIIWNKMPQDDKETQSISVERLSSTNTMAVQKETELSKNANDDVTPWHKSHHTRDINKYASPRRSRKEIKTQGNKDVSMPSDRRTNQCVSPRRNTNETTLPQRSTNAFVSPQRSINKKCESPSRYTSEITAPRKSTNAFASPQRNTNQAESPKRVTNEIRTPRRNMEISRPQKNTTNFVNAQMKLNRDTSSPYNAIQSNVCERGRSPQNGTINTNQTSMFNQNGPRKQCILDRRQTSTEQNQTTVRQTRQRQVTSRRKKAAKPTIIFRNLGYTTIYGGKTPYRKKQSMEKSAKRGKTTTNTNNLNTVAMVHMQGDTNVFKDKYAESLLNIYQQKIIQSEKELDNLVRETSNTSLETLHTTTVGRPNHTKRKPRWLERELTELKRKYPTSIPEPRGTWSRYVSQRNATSIHQPLGEYTSDDEHTKVNCSRADGSTNSSCTTEPIGSSDELEPPNEVALDLSVDHENVYLESPDKHMKHDNTDSVDQELHNTANDVISEEDMGEIMCNELQDGMESEPKAKTYVRRMKRKPPLPRFKKPKTSRNSNIVPRLILYCTKYKERSRPPLWKRLYTEREDTLPRWKRQQLLCLQATIQDGLSAREANRRAKQILQTGKTLPIDTDYTSENEPKPDNYELEVDLNTHKANKQDASANSETTELSGNECIGGGNCSQDMVKASRDIEANSEDIGGSDDGKVVNSFQ